MNVFSGLDAAKCPTGQSGYAMGPTSIPPGTPPPGTPFCLLASSGTRVMLFHQMAELPYRLFIASVLHA